MPENEKRDQDTGKRKKKSVMAMVVIAAVAGLGSAGAGLFAIRPRDPIFEVMGINVSGFNLRFCTDSPLLIAVVDVALTLSIKVTNPNVAPIQYTSTIMDIYYQGDLLGQAKVEAGSQAAKSEKVLDLPAKLDGLEMTNHLKHLFADVAKREMMISSVVTIVGDAVVWKWRHHFEIHVNSDLKVDPVFLDIIEQENRVHMQMQPII